jgi:transposase-like protein
MDLITLFQSFQTQEQAVQYLEKVRWHGHPVCPYCHSENVGRHASGDRKGSRWQCRDCTRAFAVTVGTIFHGTHIPLAKWFILLALMLNAKKSASAYQIGRDLGMRRPTVWSMMHRVRVAMAEDPEQSKLLFGIVEADETYIGGKPRKGNKRGEDKNTKRGRGTSKAAVVGMVERGGRVIAKPVKRSDLSSKGLTKLLSKFIDRAGSLLITDEFPGYLEMGRKMPHMTINHAKQYVDGEIHTNTIESFWSLVKRAWYGQRHHYSRKYMPVYIAEACYKYNNRRNAKGFDSMIKAMVRA